ncbi:MAG: phage tail tape measure protein, partial [Pseudomonadota bacterium]
ISTPDMASFQRSEAQLSATVARAVSRGRRSL